MRASLPFKQHLWTLVPLILTSLLQRAEHLVDNRFMSALGLPALSAHSIFFNLFLIGQAMGLATATSALILWRRRELRGAQGRILSTHLSLAGGGSAIIALLAFPFIPAAVRYFQIPADHAPVATLYLQFGLVNLVLQAVYGTLNAMLIACDQRMKSLILIGGLLAAKLAVGVAVLRFAWNGGNTAGSVYLPMLLIGASTIVFLVIAGTIAFDSIRKRVDGWAPIGWREVTSVWQSEVGFAVVRSMAPMIFSLQLARVLGSERFFVTYQLALQIAYILVLPLIAGGQLAVRDASEEQSYVTDQRLVPLRESRWFRPYFLASLLPSEFLLFTGALAPSLLMSVLFGYQVPSDHERFLQLYFMACMVGQLGNLAVIRLRSVKQNAWITRNSIVSEIVVQLGFMQVALWLGQGTPVAAGLVTLAYCTTHLGLNLYAVSCASDQSRTARTPAPPASSQSC